MRSTLYFLPMMAGVLLLAWSTAALAGVKTPPELEPWKEWVAFEKEHYFCPSPYNQADSHQCVWPGPLELVFTPAEGRFRQDVTVLAESWVHLPGSDVFWPGRVTANGSAAPVTLRDGRPAILVEEGTVRLEGEFRWERIPQTFPIPPMQGRVFLTVNGETSRTPFVDDSNNVWVQQPEEAASADQEDARNTTTVQIFRLVEDAIPLKITTHLRLTVSGDKRREKIGAVLPKGSQPVSIKGRLPLKLTEEQELWVEVTPGQWDMEIMSIINAETTEIGPLDPLYGDEIWAFKSVPYLRLATVSGLTPVDPSQTIMPAKWRRYPAYLMTAGDFFRLKETQRGSQNPQNDQLFLKREIWLSFDGNGATVRDGIVGSSGQRRFFGINGTEYQLGRLVLGGEDQLVTKFGDRSLGVEVAKGPVELTAVSSMSAIAGGQPFTIGWDSRFQTAEAILHLPPGWQLIGLQGGTVSDRATWLTRWSLLDFFMILVVAFAVARLWNWLWGAAFFAGLALIWHEPYAPQYVWLNVILTTALLRLLNKREGESDKRLRMIGVRVWHVGAMATLLCFALTFAATQLRWAVYPQLEPRWPVDAFQMPAKRIELRKQAARVAAGPRKELLAVEESVDRYEAEMPRADKLARQYTLAPGKQFVTQTGPGVPNWKWKSVAVKYGLVGGDHKTTVWLLSPAVASLVAFCRVGFLLALLLCFLNVRMKATFKSGRWVSRVSLLIMAAFVVGGVSEAQAGNFPSQKLLQELEKRMFKPEKCYPQCATVASAEIRVPETNKEEGAASFLEIVQVVDALIETAVPLPYGSGTWSIHDITLDKQPHPASIRHAEKLWVLIPAGRHQLSVRAKVRARQTVRFVFPLNPRFLTVQASGWRVSGLNEHHQVDNTLLLTRQVQDTKKEDSFFADTHSDLHDFLRVRRTLILGLEWKAVTVVERFILQENRRSVAVSVPLLPGELVRTEGLDVKDGKVHLELGPDVDAIQWESSLPITDDIEMSVSEDAEWAEVWCLNASPLWHYGFKSLPPVYPDNSVGTFWYPWPGEALLLNISRLEAAAGKSTTIDAVKVDYHVGEGYNKIQMNATIRTSRGGVHAIASPPGAVLKTVRISGNDFPVTGEAAKIMIPLQPGSQDVFVEWHQPVKWQTRWLVSIVKPVKLGLPEIGLSEDASNIDIFFHLPVKFWLLMAGGLRLGPAVLIWSYLAVIILAAILLAKFGRTPLRVHQWLLLGVGFVTLDAPSIVLVAAWFLAVELRKKHAPESPFWFNAMQVGFFCWGLFVAVALFRAVHEGLLGIPDMQVVGNGSTRELLHWTQDRSGSILPQPWVIVCSMYAYRAVMFVWACWLAANAVNWSRLAFEAFRENGMWRKIQIRRKRPEAHS